MKFKNFVEKNKGTKPLTVRKTLIKNTNSQNTENENLNITKDNKPYTRITINKSLLWKEQDKKTEKTILSQNNQQLDIKNQKKKILN